MEKLVKRFCRFCLNNTNDNFIVIDETIRDVLDVLLLKLDIRDNTKVVICNPCSEKLFTTFRFKATCMDTEDSIFPYINLNNGAQVDLREVYLRQRGKEHLKTLLEDEQVCRLCMQIITLGFASVNDLNDDLIQKYIPEVNFNTTKDPVICSACVDSLINHHSFLKSCPDIEKMKSFTNKIETKTERNNVDDIVMEHKVLKVHLYKYNLQNSEKVRKRGRPRSNTESYNCSLCEYKTRYKGGLQCHQLKHKHPPEEDHIRENKSGVKPYQLRHKNVSAAQMYKCNLCDCKTMYKDDVTHQRITHKKVHDTQKYKYVRHESLSERLMHKCSICDYKSMHKHNFECHLLRHKDISELQMYQCDLCDYKSIHKSNVKRHRINHKNV